MLDKIRNAALEVFHDKGFHGASIREIAEKAGCSLPTLYYYYHDKRKMFEDILTAEYESLNDRIYKTLEQEKSLDDYLFRLMRMKKGLGLRDRLIYKMAMKVWLSFEDFPDMRNQVMEIDRKNAEQIMNQFQDIFKKSDDGSQLSSLILRTVTDMTLKIILLEEEIPDEQIKKEFSFLTGKKFRS